MVVSEALEIIEHQGKKIYYMHFGKCVRAKLPEILESLKPHFSSQPQQSILSLVNVEGLIFSTEIIKAFKEFTEHNKPYVKCGAVVGIQGIQKIAYDAVMKFAGRNLPIFNTLDEAKDWLVQN